MEIQEVKTLFVKHVEERYQNDVKRIMDTFLELGLNQYPVQVHIQRYMENDEISSVTLTLIQELAAFHYSFDENGMFQSSILQNGTMFGKLYINSIQFEKETEEEFQLRLEEEETFTFEDVLDKTKEVVKRYTAFIDSLERKEW